MSEDDVMELAQRAGTYTEVEDGEEWLVMSESAFPVFAKLIIEAERDRCILMLERLHERSGGQYNYYLHAAKVLKGEV
jgi:hypothetical protein